MIVQITTFIADFFKIQSPPPPSKGAALHPKCLHKSLALLPLAPWSVLHKVRTSNYYKYNNETYILIKQLQHTATAGNISHIVKT